jgi:hypothetical protein
MFDRHCSPTSEWQDAVTSRLNARAAQRNTVISDGESFGEAAGAPALPSKTLKNNNNSNNASAERTDRPVLSVQPPAGATPDVLSPASGVERGENGQPQRQKRRVESDHAGASAAGSPASTSRSGRSQSPMQTYPAPHPALMGKPSMHSLRGGQSPPTRREEASDEETHGDDEESGEDELAIAVGQLSMNEDSQVRYHGKASGLHLLNVSTREDGRSEGGIWSVGWFPPAFV